VSTRIHTWLAGVSISKAFLLTEQGDTEPAIQALKKANGLIDPEREPRLVLCLHHNLVYHLTTAGLRRRQISSPN
jgi:hypothetical protein